jgi:hypothetical protein
MPLALEADEIQREVYGVDAFQKHCRHVGQINLFDCGLNART